MGIGATPQPILQQLESLQSAKVLSGVRDSPRRLQHSGEL